MSTTDRAAFEQYAESQGCRDFEYDQDDSQRYRNPFTQREYKYWRAALDWQAATEAAKPNICTHPEGCTSCNWCGFKAEAAKATGTAGELPPKWITEVCGPDVDGLSYGQGYRRGFNDCRKKVSELQAQAARQPAPVVAGCVLCGSAIGHDLNCQNHPVNAKAPFEQYDEHKAFMATYLGAAREASDNTSAEMILWHANRHWNGKAGEMWRARAALAATAAPVLSDEQIKEAAMQAWPNLPENWWERKGEVWNGAKVFALAILAATNRSQP